MNGGDIAIGSRGSVLALAQARLVHEAFQLEGHASRVVIIESDGDHRAPDTAWGEGAFVAFGDLVRALRSTESRRSTVADTPILLGVHRPVDEILVLLGAD